MKITHGFYGLLFFFGFKIFINLNKENLDRNYFRFDDLINLFLIFFILTFIYTNKQRMIDNETTRKFNLFNIALISTVVYYIYRTWVNLPYSFLHSDNVISSLHVNRMIYFDLNVYEATWNEHTTLLIYIQKYFIELLKFFGIKNSLLLYFLVFILFTLIGSLILVKLLSFFTDYKTIKYTIGGLYFIDSIGAGNRVLRFDTRSFGSLIMVSFIYFLYKYTYSKDLKFLYATVVLGTLTIFNLESYSITIVSIFLIYIYLEKPNFKILRKLFLCFCSTLGIIVLFHFMTGQLENLINLNILFHIQSSREGGVNLLNAISGVEFFPGLNLYTALFLIWPVFLFKYSYYLNNKNIIYLNAYLTGEVLHLILTGPRWIAYGQVMRIPLMIILCIYCNKFLINLEINKTFNNFKYEVLASLLMPIVLTAFIGGPIIFNQKIERQKEILLEESSRNEVMQVISKNLEGDSYFLWTENKNWSWMLLENNYLPATRMWLWVQAYAENKSYFSWSERWGLEKIKKFWIQDIEKESINIFVIDKNFISLPDFINEYIENNSKKVICIENFCLYKK